MSNHTLRRFTIPFIAMIIFSLGLLPVALLIWFILQYIYITYIWHFLFLPFFLYIAAGLLYFSELLLSGSIIKIFNITYKPGIYPYNYKEPMFFRWTLICTLYTPLRKILEIFPLGSLKKTYLKLLGMKIGENSLIGGVIKDPCITNIGSNVTIGEYAIIYGHIHNMEKKIIEINKVTIGNNCIIGAGAIIMPGVKIEDNTIIAAGALVQKNQHLTGNTIYVGIPVKPKKNK